MIAVNSLLWCWCKNILQYYIYTWWTITSKIPEFFLSEHDYYINRNVNSSTENPVNFCWSCKYTVMLKMRLVQGWEWLLARRCCMAMPNTIRFLFQHCSLLRCYLPFGISDTISIKSWQLPMFLSDIKPHRMLASNGHILHCRDGVQVTPCVPQHHKQPICACISSLAKHCMVKNSILAWVTNLLYLIRSRDLDMKMRECPLQIPMAHNVLARVLWSPFLQQTCLKADAMMRFFLVYASGQIWLVVVLLFRTHD